MADIAKTSAPKEATPLKVYINDDMVTKVPMAGKGAPEGAANDFRMGVKKVITKLPGKGGILAADVGTWVHSMFKDMPGTKIRWWGGLTYINPNAFNAFAAIRVYGGAVPKADTGMLAFAAAAGISPKIYGPLGVEVSEFCVFHEKYYNAGIDNANFYITTVAPYVTLGNFKIKALAQYWRVDTNKTEPWHYMQFGGGMEATF